MKKYTVLCWVKTKLEKFGKTTKIVGFDKTYEVVSVEAVEALKESRRVIAGLGSVMVLEFILHD